MNPNSRQHQLAQQLLAAAEGNLDLAVQALHEAQTKNAEPYVPKSTEVVARAVGLGKSYKVGHTKVQALTDISLDVYKGEFLALTGTSGSGKSTLLQLLGGLDKPSAGKVEVSGQALDSMHDRALSRFRNQTIGFVFQFFYLQPFLDLQTNIEVPGMFARLKRKERQERSRQLAEIVGLGERLRHLPTELSGGQMQRAAIARALLNRPTLLLADEPTGNLDHTNAMAIFDLFRKINVDHGTTIIVVTHDIELAATADRIIELRDGQII